MPTVGETLRSERLRQGLQLSAITSTTKIPRDYLEAMEAGRLDLLPGGAYRRSFLRQYAHSLGLDEEATIASFHEQYEDPPVALPPPVPDRPSERWKLAGALLALVISFLVYRAAVNARATPGTDMATAALPLPPAGETAHHATPDTQHAPARGEAARSDAAQPLRVTFSVTEPVWLSVQCDGAEAFTGTLEGAQTKTFEALRQVTVVVGNAGGLAIQFNERRLGPLGGHGETQTVEFTASGVRRVPRRPATLPGGDAVPQG